MSDRDGNEEELPKNVYERIKASIVELHQVEASVEKYKETKDPEQMKIAVAKLDQLSLQLEEVSELDEAQTRQNAPMLMKLYVGIDNMTKEIFQTACSVNKASTKPRASTNPHNERKTSAHRIRDSLEFDETAHNSATHTGSEFNKKPLQGYLKKQGEKGMKLWKVRWFRQIKQSLYYFVSETSTTTSGYIDFSNMISVHFPKSTTSCEFQISTPSRVYRLQALSITELDYWRKGLEYWRSVYPCSGRPLVFDKQTMEKRKRGASTLSGLSRMDFRPDRSNSAPLETNIIGDDSGDELGEEDVDNLPQTLYDALEVIRIQRQEICEFEERVKRLEEQETLTAPQKITELRNENNQLRKELDLKDSLLNEFEQSTYTLQKESQLQKKLSGVDHDQYVARLLHEIKQMENKLRATEDREINYKKTQKNLLDKNKQLESKLQSTSESLKQLRMEMTGKDKYITKLTMQLKHAKPTSETKKQIPSAMPTRVKEEIDRLQETIQAHQTRNVYLSAEVTRIEEESKAKLKSKQETIARLETELEALNKQYQELRTQNLMLKGADDTYLQELENIKKALFYSIGVGIKLNFAAQERPCNVDIQSLYYQAQHIHWSEWNEWLTKRINEHVSGKFDLSD